jgi:predicted nuclease with TOPRIM domain
MPVINFSKSLDAFSCSFLRLSVKIITFVPQHRVRQMANEKVLISGIEYKVRKLIEKHELLSAENKQLKEEVTHLKNEIVTLRELLDKKNNEFLTLTLANAFENKFGVEKGIQIIDTLVEEIDRSMDVISK